MTLWGEKTRKSLSYMNMQIISTTRKEKKREDNKQVH
jgi:hypothetical protein